VGGEERRGILIKANVWIRSLERREMKMKG